MAKTTKNEQYQIDKKWTKATLSEGWTALPNILLLYQVRLKLKPQHVCVLLHLISYWWEDGRNPFPSTKTLAQRIGIQPRQVRRYFEYLESEIEIDIGGKVIKGLVKRIKRFDTNNSRASNEYDLSNLIEALKLLAKEREDSIKNLSRRVPTK